MQNSLHVTRVLIINSAEKGENRGPTYIDILRHVRALRCNTKVNGGLTSRNVPASCM